MFALAVSWANSNEGFLLAVLTLLYTVATILIYRANRQAVEEMRLGREEETRPYVIAGLEFDFDRRVLEFVVRNAGKTAAYNIRIKASPELPAFSPDRRPLSETSLFRKGITMLSPGQEIRSFLATASEVYGDHSTNLPTFTFHVSYQGKRTGKKYKEYEFTSTFDPEELKDVPYIVRKGLHDLVKEVTELKKEVESLRRAVERRWAVLDDS